MQPATRYATDDLTLAYIGNFRGFQRPCGCVATQNGGLLRLGSALDALRRRVGGITPENIDEAAEESADALLRPPELTLPQAVALVELGNFADSRDRQAGLRAAMHLRALEQLGAAAAVLGGEEAALSVAEAQTAFAAAPVPLLSCNITGELEGVELRPAVEIAPGWQLIGVTVPRSSTAEAEPWATVRDARAGVEAALDALPANSRAIVAAAQLPPALAEQLASLPGVHAVIGQSDVSDKPSGLSPLLPPPQPRAFELTVASLRATAQPLSWPVPLTEEWADDQRIAELLRQGNAQRLVAARADPGQWRKTSWTMSERFLPAAEQLPPAEQTYAGADACIVCHSGAHESWLASRHHHAYESLLERHEAQTLDCLECHTTGLLLPGGYDPDASYDVLHDPLARVGCESCHGPGQAHVELAATGEITAGMSGAELKIVRSDLQLCVRCHDEYNSPDFEPDSYWQQISH